MKRDRHDTVEIVGDRVAEHMKYTDLLKLKSTDIQKKKKKKKKEEAVVCIREHLQN